MECEYCANYHKCEYAFPQDYCQKPIKEIYDVIPDGLVFDVSDFNETDRMRINHFFKINYGFEFKDINGMMFDIQLNDAIMRTKKARDIVIEMAKKVYRTKTSPAQHRHINWTCFRGIEINTDVGISEEQVKAMYFKLPKTDAIITQIDCELDSDDEATLYVYIENGDPDNWLQETLDWCVKLTETGNEHSLSDEDYGGMDVVIIYWGEFQ